jgi:Zn-dependent membrane protease YugP
MIPDSLKLLVDLYKDANSQVLTLWSIYSAVVFGLLGFIIGGKQPVPGRGKLALGIAFAVFATANAYALFTLQTVAYSASSAIRSFVQSKSTVMPSEIQTIVQVLTASSPSYVVLFQIAITVFCLSAIYWAHTRDSQLALQKSQESA